MLIVVIYIIPKGQAAGSFRFLNLHHYMGITMGSVLIEQNSLSQSGEVIFKKESYESLLTSDVQEKFLVIAKEQATMLAA